MNSAMYVANNQIDMTSVPDDLVFGLDIGTRSIVGTVGYKSNTKNFVVVAQVVQEHETRAMIDGQIHDIGKVAETIVKIKEQLQEMTGRTFRDVCIAAAGRVLKTVEAAADITFGTDVVVNNEHVYSLNMLGVEKAYDELRSSQENTDIQFYCVGYSVKQYYQNDYPISNLEGHKCSKITTELIATFLPEEVVDGLYAAVERAGLYVANLTLEPIAAINMAIPERYRLLNIALVDVGAGTSDISITKDGSIIAYGMIPYAGDELTENIARQYLTDFTEADRMKCASTTEAEVVYHDIMGLEQKISSEELVASVEDTVKMITKSVSDKIIELNGGKPVSAIFVVGGGGKIKGFVENLAEYQGIQKERVALRGPEVMGNVRFLQEDIEVTSLLVTPVGICLNYYEQKNNFIFVVVNDTRIKLYDNNKLTIMDAAMQVGFPNEDLFPKRGKAVTYYVAGEKRMLRGEAGEAAIVHLNGKVTGINTPIQQNDKIEITPSTTGVKAELTIGSIPEYKSNLTFTFNNKQITCSRFVSVNGELVSAFYEIKDGDRIEILDYYTLKQVLEFMDIIDYDKVYVNNMPATMDTKVYDNFTITCDLEEQTVTHPLTEEKKEEQQETTAEEAVVTSENEQTAPIEQPVTVPAESSRQLEEAAASEMTEDITSEEEMSASFDETTESVTTPVVEEKKEEAAVHDITITVNGDVVVLRNKASYILVDILDFYPVDTAVAHGERLDISVNGIACDFTQKIEEGDAVRIEWV